VFRGSLGDARSDVYAYAVILWQLKEMNTTYKEQRPDIIQASVISGIQPVLSDSDCPDGFKELITRCWHENPDFRLSFGGEYFMFLVVSDVRLVTLETTVIDGITVSNR
jgi:hypothetical protein